MVQGRVVPGDGLDLFEESARGIAGAMRVALALEECFLMVGAIWIIYHIPSRPLDEQRQWMKGRRLFAMVCCQKVEAQERKQANRHISYSD